MFLASVQVFAIVGSHPSPLKNIVVLMLILLNRLRVYWKQSIANKAVQDIR